MYRTIDKDQYFVAQCNGIAFYRHSVPGRNPDEGFFERSTWQKINFPISKIFRCFSLKIYSSFQKNGYELLRPKTSFLWTKGKWFQVKKMEQKQLKNQLFFFYCRNGEKFASAQRFYRTHKNFRESTWNLDLNRQSGDVTLYLMQIGRWKPR